MSEDLLSITEGLEQAVRARDASAAATALRLLSGKDQSRAGQEFFDRLDAVLDELIVLLLDGLDPSEFGRCSSSSGVIHAHDVWEVLERTTHKPDASALWDLSVHLGLPSPDLHPKLHAVLAGAKDEKSCRDLIESIDRLATAEAAEEAGLSDHERTLSTFRTIRWDPDDKGLSGCVRLLAARSDECAREACGRYLMELPWGADRLATRALIDGLEASKGEGRQSLFMEALSRHRGPAVLRTWLWGVVGEGDSQACVLGILEDLARAEGDDDRMIWVEFLDACLSELAARRVVLDREPITAAAEGVDASNWSWVVRGCYGTVLEKWLPEAEARRVSRRLERFAIAIGRAWEAVRLEHMDFLIPLALMIGAGWLAGYGLDWLLGEPVRVPALPRALFCAWIGWSVITMRTHFSGHETVAGRVGKGIAYFALFLGTLAAAVAVRIG